MSPANNIYGLGLASIFSMGLFVLGVDASLADTAPKKLPPFARVEQVVIDHFQSLPGYRPGAIVSRGQVEAVLRRLERIGWSVPDRAAILARVLSDDDWLVQELRTSDGQNFAARIARFPQGYDRVDRLSRLIHGKRTVYDLIHGAGGYRMIEYMTRSSGGIELGKMLSRAPHGADFNNPTGRIYTVDGLLAELKRACPTSPQEDR